MTNAAQAEGPAGSLSSRVAAELRAELARQRMSGRRLARELKVAHTWTSQRLNGAVALSADDIERIAGVLLMSPDELWGRLRPYPGTAQLGYEAAGPSGITDGTTWKSFTSSCADTRRHLRLVAPGEDSSASPVNATACSSEGCSVA